MDVNTPRFMLLFGLVSACFSQVYHVVHERKTWTQAQAYCREKYTDLVTINSTEDMALVKKILGINVEEFWIGLYGDLNNWRWSLERDGFYEQGQADFRLWNSGEPNNAVDDFQCADTQPIATWSDYGCYASRPFVCYSDSAPKYIFVNSNMTWTKAQLYCRTNYVDLASIRNQSENEEIRKLVSTYTWIGLYRESWRWSDGQRLRMTSFSKWDTSQSETKVENSCVTTTSSTWNKRPCSSTYSFICMDYPETIQRKVVKIYVSKSDSSLNLEALQDAILLQMNSRLRENGLGEVKLKWMKQPDGKIFSEKKETKKIKQ
ncbi:lymphocyte antigen 75-like [Fundulus diaphanus]